jgi:hypothetical protein
VRIGAVAATAAVLAGLVVVLAKGSNSSDSKSSSAVAVAPTTRPAPVPSSPAYNDRTLGTTARIENGTQLDAFVHGLLEKTLVPSAADSANAQSSSKSTQAVTTEKLSNEFAPSAPPTCANRVAAEKKAASPALASAPVQYRSTPATVVVFETAQGRVAVVYAPSSCQVLLSRPAK